MKRTKITTNQWIDNNEILVEFLNNESTLVGNLKVELTTGLGTFNYTRIGGCWYQE